ncbi:hypothetical protein CTEN210_02245 [Chaetoceros tenuissimus]|uniref:ERCC4 domain-containing protein n=1 Tax=Chaetoceros tenuissimus TaxID=426638 RepID=A0AAD3CJ35_9STRA|nr:hypothetical protein CTEN210_02245 [Chaetoceros tenuissimus]
MSASSCWKVVLLMDHREFTNSKIQFKEKVKKCFDNRFRGSSPVDAIYPTYCEETTLCCADYMFVARQINPLGQVIEERVFDFAIERKNVDDLQNCLIKPSKKYAPLSFFEAQMYKLQMSDLGRKVFLMEGDEDKVSHVSSFGKDGQKELRLKRIKTMRNQLLHGEWKGVQLECTRDKKHSLLYLADQMIACQRKLAANEIPLKTMEQHKNHVNSQMKNATFLEYLRLRKIKGTGDKKAMKAIMDPESEWDKNFISPACTSKSKEYKSTLEDRAIYYISPYSNKAAVSRKIASTSSSQQKREQKRRGKDNDTAKVTQKRAKKHSNEPVKPPTYTPVAYHNSRRDLSGGSGLGLGGFEFGSGSKQSSQYSALTEMENAVNALYSTKPQPTSKKPSLTTTTTASSSMSSSTSIQNGGSSVINLTSPTFSNINSVIESSTEVHPTQNRGQASSRTVSPTEPMPSAQDLRTRVAEAAIRRASGWNNMSIRTNSGEVIIPPPFHGFENTTETNSQSEDASKSKSDVVVLLDSDNEIESDDEVKFVCTQKETRLVQDKVFELDV